MIRAKFLFPLALAEVCSSSPRPNFYGSRRAQLTIVSRSSASPLLKRSFASTSPRVSADLGFERVRLGQTSPRALLFFSRLLGERGSVWSASAARIQGGSKAGRASFASQVLAGSLRWQGELRSPEQSLSTWR